MLGCQGVRVSGCLGVSPEKCGTKKEGDSSDEGIIKELLGYSLYFYLRIVCVH